MLRHEHSYTQYTHIRITRLTKGQEMSWNYSNTFGKGLVRPDGPLSHSNHWSTAVYKRV